MIWETAATFDNAVAAEMAKNMLSKSHGLKVMLTDEETVAIAWQLSSAVGGIKLLVPAHDLGRAEFLLDLKSEPPATDEEIAEAIAERPETVAAFPGPPEPFDDTATDRQLDRAFKVSVLGLMFLPTQFIDPIVSLCSVPMQLYGLYLLATLRYNRPPFAAANGGRSGARCSSTCRFGSPRFFRGPARRPIRRSMARNGKTCASPRSLSDALLIDLPANSGTIFANANRRWGP